jgi:hypothetical protein
MDGDCLIARVRRAVENKCLKQSLLGETVGRCQGIRTTSAYSPNAELLDTEIIEQKLHIFHEVSCRAVDLWYKRVGLKCEEGECVAQSLHLAGNHEGVYDGS